MNYWEKHADDKIYQDYQKMSINQFTLRFLYTKMINNSSGSIFVTHGGGPMPIIKKQEHAQMYRQFEEIRKRYPKPKAIIIFSAHWEEEDWSILDCDNPGLYFDYGGFPPETYKYQYPAGSTPQLRNQVIESIGKSGIKLKKYTQKRGYDHGVFIPLMIMYPSADIPVIQISLLESLDPDRHFEMGKALRQLKHNGFLVLGSGASMHGGWGNPKTYGLSVEFDKELTAACLKDCQQSQLKETLKNWRKFKHATYLHPREQHLVPLFISLGAAEGNQRERWGLQIMGGMLSSYVFK